MKVDSEVAVVYSWDVAIIQITNKKIDAECKVDKRQFERCCHDLQVKDILDFKAKFRKVCDWFIKDNQYVPFEEIKTTNLV